jgi:hypothetical protein
VDGGLDMPGVERQRGFSSHPDGLRAAYDGREGVCGDNTGIREGSPKEGDDHRSMLHDRDLAGIWRLPPGPSSPVCRHQTILGPLELILSDRCEVHNTTMWVQRTRAVAIDIVVILVLCLYHVRWIFIELA